MNHKHVPATNRSEQLTLDTPVDTAEVQKKLLFLPSRLTDGIELSDDRLPVIRSEVYVLAFARRAR